MAIEFNCPYCTALIRVPDNAGGGKGRCPKCATRISVPKVSAPKRAAPPVEEEVVFAPPSTDAPFFAPVDSPSTGSSQIGAPVEDDPLDVQFASASDAVEASLPSDTIDIFGTPQRAFGEPSVVPSQTARRAGSVAAKLQRKRAGGGWKIPVVVGLFLCAAAGGGFYWQQHSGATLSGELIAEAADALDLPPVLVGKSLLGSSTEIVEAVLTKLEKSPLPLTSGLMLVQLSGSSKGLLIRLNTGLQSRFYKVEVRDNVPLRQYRSKHAPELEEERIRGLEQAARSFATAYSQVIAKKADLSSITGFRDTLALPALVRGVGHQLIATHRRTAYPCVYEDYEGAWYFLMPPDIKEFQITGRQDSHGTVLFPATYNIKVVGLMKSPVKQDDAKQDGGASAKPKGKSQKASQKAEEPAEELDLKHDASMKPKAE